MFFYELGREIKETERKLANLTKEIEKIDLELNDLRIKKESLLKDKLCLENYILGLTYIPSEDSNNIDKDD